MKQSGVKNERAAFALSGHLSARAVITLSLAALLITIGCPQTVKGKTGSDAHGTDTPPVPAPTAVQKYAVTFGVDGTPANGTLKAKADGIAETEVSPITVEHGTTVTFTAIPASGYEAEQWTNGGAPVSEAGTGTTYNRTVTANADIKVKFKSVTPAPPAPPTPPPPTPPTPPALPTDKTYTVDGVRFTMKDIAAVTDGTVGRNGIYANPPHTVSLSAYRIGETEVTQELWNAVTGKNPSGFKDKPHGTEVQQKRPVERVTWFDCIAFCNELTAKTTELGKAQCVYYLERELSTVYTAEHAVRKKVPFAKWNAKGFRLPTEAEWEWAAQGGTNDKWAGTNTESEPVNYAWYDANSGGKTHEVKLKRPNGYGLYDMSGNVYEWCWDKFSSRLPHPVPPDYGGTASGRYYVIRGGCCSRSAWMAVCANRNKSASPEASVDCTGVRVAQRP